MAAWARDDLRTILRCVALMGAGYSMAPVSVVALAQQPPAASQLSSPDKKALSDFSNSAKQYIAMEHNLPADKLKPTTDVAALEQQRVALRDALKAARPNARQGDLFTPPVAAAFRRLLSETMSGPRGKKIRTSLAHAEPGSLAAFTVNGIYPDTGGRPIQSAPPTLLMNLPPLPKGLEYRIAGKALALRDATANLVVDFIPDALP